ncbi:MAG TPA: o-succinylbenzoate synthase [Thermoguttaceae bacterium]|nr:o-succinylbenzoate synthase [Thermoguttaceae bacterium]
MRFDSIELYHVAMPLLYPWRTAYGEDAAVESVLVRTESEGLVVWSETSPLAAPCYSPEWAGGVFACLRDWLAPAVVKRDFRSPEELQERLAPFKGNPCAKAPLDVAWWLLDSVARGQPLHQRLGATRSAIDVGADFGIMDSIDDLLAAIDGAVEAGFKRIKLKFRPGWDLDMLRAVRRRFPDQTFHIDCNSGYRLEDLDLFKRIDEFGLAMIEQPLGHDDLVDHAKLQREIETPVCLDESITSPDKARKAIELGSCEYVNVKVARVGGLTPAVAIHDMCRDVGTPCWVGSMLESAVGTRVNAALAMLDNFTYPADLFPSGRFYQQDLGRPAVELTWVEDGSPQIALGEEPGIAAEPDPALLEQFCVARAAV